MNRNSLSNIIQWYKSPGRKPLIIRGARQVGKSTLVRMAAKQLNIRLVEVNCERYPHLNSHFATFDIQRILREIELNLNCSTIEPAATLLFIDEIQATPDAIAALRYFYEDLPGLAVVAAGSLLEFTLSNHSFSMPVGRIEYLFLGPMSFSEYLFAIGETALAGLIETYTHRTEISTASHERLTYLLRDYFSVGGMPEAVKQWSDTHNTDTVSAVHASILQTYRDDFAKYASGMELVRLQRVFDYIPAAVGEKIKYATINRDWTARDIRYALDLLCKAGIVLPVHHSHATGIPLGAGKDDTVFKTYFLDVGLMNFACAFRPMTLEQLQQVDFINSGKIAEQMIGQHLWFSGPWYQKPSLFYWLREGKSTNAEVDYVLQVGSSIVPVEVKSGKAGSLRSLHQFVSTRGVPVALRFDLNPPSVQDVSLSLNVAGNNQEIQFKLVSLPLYLVQQAQIVVQDLIV